MAHLAARGTCAALTRFWRAPRAAAPLVLTALLASLLPSAASAQDLPTLSMAVVAKSGVADSTSFISVDEDVGTVQFTVTLSAASTGTVTVEYATEDIPDDDQVFTGISDALPATAGEDYTAVSGTLTFAPGETSKTVSVRIIDETLFERARELFRAVLSNPSGATIAAGEGQLLFGIVNGDPLPPVSVMAAGLASTGSPGAAASTPEGKLSVAEGDSGETDITFTFTQSHVVSWRDTEVGSFRIPVGITGTATADTDFEFTEVAASDLTITLRATRVEYTLEIKGDTDVEGDEVFYIALQRPDGIVTNSGEENFLIEVTIVDDDGVPSAPSAPRLTASASGQLTVNWAAPADDGGRPVTDYDVRYRVKPTSGDPAWTELADTSDSTALMANLTGLTNGAAYQVQVRAQNENGNGAWSAATEATPVASGPSPTAEYNADTRRLTVRNAQVTSAVATFAQANSGHQLIFIGATDIYASQVMNVRATLTVGGTRLAYSGTCLRGDCRFNTAGRWSASTTGAATLEVDLPSGFMPPAQLSAVYLAVDDVNDRTHSIATNVRLDTVRSAPAMPSNLTLALRPKMATLRWSDPGDSSITGYQYRVGTSGVWTELPGSGATTTSFDVFDGLTGGSPQTIQLRAVNPSGGSAPASVVSAAPAAPTGVTAAPLNASARLRWSDPADPSIIKYQFRVGANGAWTDIAGSSAASVTGDASGLTNGSAQTLFLRAVNFVGPSAASSSVSVTPTVNPAPTVANAIPDQVALVGAPFSYVFPANTFNDADGDSLTYTASKSDDAALPSWLVFTAGTRSFAGTPQSTDTGRLSLKVTASDGTNSVSDTFDIVVSAPLLDGLALALRDGTAVALTPAFSGATKTYTATVPDGTALAELTPTASSTPSGITVAVDGVLVASGTARAVTLFGASTEVRVVARKPAPNPQADEYLVTITQTNPPGGEPEPLETQLSALQLKSGDRVFTQSSVTGTDPTVIAYRVPVDVDSVRVTPTVATAGATVTVNGKAVASGAPSALIPLNVGVNAIVIVVTSPDGMDSRTYRANVQRAAMLGLSALTLATGTLDGTTFTPVSTGILNPSFSPETLEYQVVVDRALDSLRVTPTVAAAGATVTVNGTAVTSGSASGVINLATGRTRVSIEVTAAGGATATYSIEVYRPSDAAVVNEIKLRAVAPGEPPLKIDLDPRNFDGLIYTYRAQNAIPPGRTLEVKASARYANAGSYPVINGRAATQGQWTPVPLDFGENTVSVSAVRFGNFFSVGQYDVTVVKTHPAALSGLTLSAGTLRPAFDPAITEYQVTLPRGVSAFTVTPQSDDSALRAGVGETPTVAAAPVGAPGAPVSLTVGETRRVYVYVRDEDQTGARRFITPRTYQLRVTRSETQGASDASLSALALDEVARAADNSLTSLNDLTLTPAFATETTNYALSVPPDFTLLRVRPTTTDDGATVRMSVNGSTLDLRSPTALSAGANEIVVRVTAADGATDRSYRIVATRRSSATLDALNLRWASPGANEGPLDLSLSDFTAFNPTPAFAAGTASYTASVPHAATLLRLNPSPTDPAASVTVNGEALNIYGTSYLSLVPGGNRIALSVLGADGVSRMDYSLLVARAQPPSGRLSLSFANQPRILIQAGAVMESVTLPAATGGKAPYKYALVPRAPIWLSLDEDTHVLSVKSGQNVPAGTGSDRVSVQVTDADDATATASFNLVRAALAFGVVPPLDRVFTVNQEITNLVLPAATGGTGAVTYTLTPELPAGLAFTAATRTLSGTPTATAATTVYTYLATDSNTPTASTAQLKFSLTVEANRMPSFGAASVRDQVLVKDELAPSLRLPAASSGNAPFTYALSPALPAGLAFNAATRTLGGTPTAAAAAADYTLTVTDADGQTATLTFMLEVLEEADSAPLLPVDSVLPDVVWTKDAQIETITLPAATGGDGALTYALTPNLPAGLTFNAAMRTISGTPTAVAPRRTYTYQVSDADSNTADSDGDRRRFALSVSGGPLVYPATPSKLQVGTAMRGLLPVLTGLSGTPTYTLTGALPAGLSLDAATGIIGGTPSAVKASVSTVTVTVAAGGQSASEQLTFPAVTAKPTAVSGVTVTPMSDTELFVEWTAATVAPDGYWVRWRENQPGQRFVSRVETTKTSYTIEGLRSGTAYLVRVDTLKIDRRRAAGTAQTATGTTNKASEGSAPYLQYSNLPDKLVVGEPISPLAPEVANFADGAVITYSFSVEPGNNLPSGLSLDAETGVISGTPDTADSEKNQVMFTATAGEQTASFGIFFPAVERGFKYPVPGPLFVDVGITPLEPTVSGFTGELTFRAITNPLSGILLNTETGVIFGAPNAVTSGPVEMTVEVLGTSQRAAHTLRFPRVQPTPNLRYAGLPAPLQVGAPVSLAPTVASSFGTVTSYALTGALPAGLSFNTSTGVISGAPTTPAQSANEQGVSVTVTATAGSGDSEKTATASVEFQPVRYAPPTIAAIADIASLVVGASQRAPVTLSGVPAGASVAIGAVLDPAGRAVGTVGTDSITLYGLRAGTLTVTVTATVGEGVAASPEGRTTFSLTVTDAALTAEAGNPPSSTAVGTAVTLAGSASGGVPGVMNRMASYGYAWTVVSEPTSSSVSITNADKASASFTPTHDGTYQLRLTVTDSATPTANTATDTVDVVVPTSPSANSAPTVANAIPDQAATVDTAFSYVFPTNTFSDADNDSLTYTAMQTDGTTDSALPSWLAFTAAERKLAGTPTSTDTGTLSVKVTASDGTASVSDTFDIVVSATEAEGNKLTTPTVTLIVGDTWLRAIWPANIGTVASSELQWKAASAMGWSGMGVTTVTSAKRTGTNIIGLTTGTEYEVRVRDKAVANSPDFADSDWSSPVSATPKGIPAPTGLVVEDEEDTALTLRWTPPADTRFTGYEINQDDSGWEQLDASMDSTDVRITGLTNEQSYSFQLRAVRAVDRRNLQDEVVEILGAAKILGAATPAVSGMPGTRPRAPEMLTAEAGNGQVKLTWEAPSFGGTPTGYEISSDGGKTWKETKSTALSYTVMDLTNGQAYVFLVRAVNAIGTGPPSGSASATPRAVPAAPTALAAAAGNAEVKLTWTAHPEGVTLLRFEYTTDSGTTWTAIEGNPVSKVSHVVTGLTNDQEYTFRLRVVNSVGNSAASTAVKATPTATGDVRFPAPVTGLTVTATAQRELTASWMVASHAPGGYELRWRKVSDFRGADSDKKALAATATSHKITGLDPGTDYIVAIVTLDSSSAEVSDTVVDTRVATLNAPTLTYPALPTVLRAGVAFETLTPTPAGFESGSTYTYAVTTGDLPPGLELDGTTGAISGKPNTPKGTRTPVTVTVTGTTGTGMSQQTETATATLDFPRIFRFKLPAPTVTLARGDAQLTANWEAVADADAYALQWKASTTSDWSGTGVTTVDPATPGTVITGLTNGDTYDVRVRSKAASASTTHIDGDWSSAVQGTPIADSRPTISGFALVKSNNDFTPYAGGPYDEDDRIFVSVNFSKNVTFPAEFPPTLTLIIGDQERQVKFLATNGERMIFRYTVAAADSGPVKIKANSLDENGGTIFREGGNADTAADQALLTFAEVDTGQRVGPITGVLNLKAEATAGESLMVSWTAALDAPGGYLVRWREWKQGSSLNAGETVSAASYTITGLTNGQEYLVRVDKLDADGNAIDDAFATTRGTPAASPTGVTNLSVEATARGELTVSWTAASVAPNGYRLRWRKTDDDNLNTGEKLAAGTTSHKITGLDDETAYRVRIDTLNADDSLASGTAVSKDGTTLSGVATPPRDLTLAAGAAAGSIDVSWTAALVGSNGYLVRWRAGGATELNAGEVVASGAATAYTITGLTAGTGYIVRVDTRDANGNLVAGASASGSFAVSAADTAPKFADGATIADQSWTVGTEITAFTLPAATGGNGAISYALTPALPAGVSLNSSTREVSGTPTAAAAAATYTWRASDSDTNTANSDTAALTFSVTVNKAKLAKPTGLGLKTDSKTKTGFTITWSTVSNAAGYTAQAVAGSTTVNGVVSGTNTEAVFTGLTVNTAYKVTVTATGDANYANSDASDEFDASTAANRAPTVANAIPDQAATVNAAFSHVFPTNTFNDADSDSLTYTAMQTDGTTDSALPSWLVFTAAERKLAGTPKTADIGTLKVKVTASDGTASVSDTFDIVVSAAPVSDTAPAFAQGATIADQSWTVGTEITAFTLPAATGGNGAISYALTPALPAGVSLNSSTREVSGTPTAAAAAATYTWRASDSDTNTANSDTAALTFSVTVNKAKLAKPTGLGLKTDSKTKTGFTITWSTVSNAAGYTAQAVAGSTTVNGVVSGTNTEAVFTGLTVNTAYKVTVTATGDANYANSDASDEFDASTAANRAPTVANAIPDQAATVNAAFSHVFPTNTFNDADSDSLTYTAMQTDGTTDSALPSWLVFTAAERKLAGTPKTADIGTLKVKVTASDGTASVSDTFDIVVSAAPVSDTAPAFAQGATIADQSWTVGTEITAFTLPAATGGNGAISYALTPALPAGVSLNSSTREVSGTPTAAAAAATYTWRASDSDTNTANSDTAALTFSVTVNKAKLAKPTGLGLKTDSKTKTGFTITWSTVSNAAGYTAQAVAGSTTVNGVVSGTNTEAVFTGLTVNTAYKVTVTATGDANYANSDASDEFDASTAANRAPTVANAIPDQAATVNAAFSHVFPTNTFNDADSDSLTYTAMQTDGTTDSALPSWLVFTAAERKLAGTPKTADIGTLKVKVTASDGTASVSDTFDIVVSAAPVSDTAPAFAQGATIADQSWTVGTEITAFTLPAATGGNGAISYALTPALPAGVSLNSSTREVSGTPTAAAAQATYTWRASDSDTNTANSDTAALTFSVTVGEGTPAEAPTGVTDLSVEATAKGELTVSWTAASVAPNGYRLRWRKTDGTFNTGEKLAAGTTSHKITGLDDETTYRVRIDTLNADDSLASGTAVSKDGTTLSGVATPPRDLTLAAGTAAGSIDVSWTAALVGSNGYLVRWRAGGATELNAGEVVASGAATAYTITGLTAGTGYIVRVDTRDANGNVVAGAFASATLALAANQAPAITDITNKTATFGANLLVDVSATDADTGDTLQYKASSSDTTIATASPTSLADLESDSQVTVTPVGAGTATITVTVSDGTDEATDTFAVAVSRAALGKPDVTVNEADGRLWATWWDVPNAAGYELEYKESDETTWKGNDDDSSPANILSLTNGQEYDVRVRAKAASASTTHLDSEWSDVKKGTPAAPDTAPGFGSETVAAQSWTVGTEITAFTLPAATGGNGAISYVLTPALPAGVSLNTSTREVSGTPTAAAAEATYTWRASDGDSNTADSDTAALTFSVTVGAATPTKVTNLQVTALDESLMVSWTAASVAPNGYSVRWRERAPGKALSPVNDVAGTSFTIDDLTNGQEYVVRVETRNAADDGVQAGTAVTGTGTPAVSDTAPKFADGATIADQTFTVDAQITAFTLPAATGGNGAISHALTPALPAGVSLNTSTREVSGTPTAAAAAATYTWRASDSDTNTANSDTAALTFSVTVNKAKLAKPTGLGLKTDSKTKTGFTVTWTAVSNAAGYTAQAVAGSTTVNGVVSGTNTEAVFTGLTVNTAYKVTVTATGDANYANSDASDEFDASTAANRAPTVANAIPNQAATVNAAFSYVFPTNTFNDADSDSLTYTAMQTDGTTDSALPSWLVFTAAERKLAGTPKTADIGTLKVKVTASDGTASVSDTFDIVVSAADTAPAFAQGASIPDRTLTVGAQITAFTLPAATGGNGAISYELSPALPAGVSLNSSTREVSGTPTAAAAQATYTWRASDSDTNTADSDTAALTFSVTVGATPTRVTNLRVTPLDGALMVSWTAATVAPNGYSVLWRERGSGHDLSLADDVTGASFTIDGLTNGQEYVVRVVTRNGADSGGRDGPAVVGSGTPSVRDTAPAFAQGASIPAQSWTVGTEITAFILPAATGGNGAVSYELTPALPAGVSLNRGTREVSGTPTAAAAATYTWRASDSDSNTANSDSAALTFRVTADRPTPTGATNLRVTAGNGALGVSWTAASRAPNGYSVRWRERRPDSRLTAINRVAGASFTIPNLTNGVAYIVRVDTRNEADSGIQADTLLSGTGTPDASGNLAPTVAAIGDRSLTFGTDLDVDVDASDVDGDDLTYKASSSDTAVATVSPTAPVGHGGGSRVRVTPVGAGTATVTVTVSDGANEASASFEVSVLRRELDAPSVRLEPIYERMRAIWAAVEGASSYDVEVRESGSDDYWTTGTFTDPGVEILLLSNGVEYEVRVRAKAAAGSRTHVDGDWSEIARAAPLAGPTRAADLEVAPGNGSLAVSWRAAVYAPRGYSVRWRKAGAGGSLSPVKRVDGTSFTIPNLANGATYVVRLDTLGARGLDLQPDTDLTAQGKPSAVAARAAAEAPLATLSVGDAEGGEGDVLEFGVALSEASAREVRVRWRTEPGTARAGEDYESGGGELVFAPGETARAVRVRTLDDAHDDPGETFRVVLSGARGAALGPGREAIGTIRNADPMPAGWLARFGRAAAEQALDGIARRIAEPRTAGRQGTLGGAPIGGAAPDGESGGLPGGPSALGGGLGGLNGGLNGGMVGGQGAGFGSGAGVGMGGYGYGNGTGGMAGGYGNGMGGMGGNYGMGGGMGGAPPHVHGGRGMAFGDLLAASSFALVGKADRAGRSAALWGRGARSSFHGMDGAASVDGTLSTATLGADYGGGRWLAGLALSRTVGEGGYRLPGAGSGRIRATLGTAIPYASLNASDRLSLWAAAGGGSGALTLTPDGAAPTETGIDWRMAALGLRGDLLSGASGPALAFVSDALWSRTASERAEASGAATSLAASSSATSRLRLGLEGSWALPLGLTPKLEAGVRRDAGDAGSGFGLEIGGGLAWSAPGLGLNLDLSGRTLIASGAGGDSGFSAALGYDPSPASLLGLSLTLRQDLGGSSSGGLAALFAPDLPTSSFGGGQARWTTEAAYGLPAFGGRFTLIPVLGYGAFGAGHDYSLGWRLEPSPDAEGAPNLSLGLRATRREPEGAPPDHGVEVEVRARW